MLHAVCTSISNFFYTRPKAWKISSDVTDVWYIIYRHGMFSGVDDIWYNASLKYQTPWLQNLILLKLYTITILFKYKPNPSSYFHKTEIM